MRNFEEFENEKKEAEKELKELNKKMKIAGIILYAIHIFAVIVSICKYITTKNNECIVTIFWTISSLFNFHDYERERRWNDDRISFRDKIISSLFSDIRKKQKELDNVYNKIDEANKFLETLESNENVKQLIQILNH